MTEPEPKNKKNTGHNEEYTQKPSNSDLYTDIQTDDNCTLSLSEFYYDAHFSGSQESSPIRKAFGVLAPVHANISKKTQESISELVNLPQIYHDHAFSESEHSSTTNTKLVEENDDKQTTLHFSSKSQPSRHEISKFLINNGGYVVTSQPSSSLKFSDQALTVSQTVDEVSQRQYVSCAFAKEKNLLNKSCEPEVNQSAQLQSLMDYLTMYPMYLHGNTVVYQQSNPNYLSLEYQPPYTFCPNSNYPYPNQDNVTSAYPQSGPTQYSAEFSQGQVQQRQQSGNKVKNLAVVGSCVASCLSCFNPCLKKKAVPINETDHPEKNASTSPTEGGTNK